MPRLAKVERKVEYFPCISEIKEVNDAKYQIGGYLNYLNNIDFGQDRTMPGAFRKTLHDSYARKTQQHLDFLFPYLFNHDYSQLPPGGIYDADEDKKGLYVRVQFNPDIQMARELFSSFKMKTMTKQSMGYKCIQSEFVKDEKTGQTIRNLLEVAVMEGSAVVFPMNDLAQVDTVKNRRTFYMPTLREMGANINDVDTVKNRRTFVMSGKEKPILTKDYAASYAQVTQQDWVSDLWNLWYPLKNEIITAFQIGDSPEADVKAALAQFATATLAYIQRGIELDMTECLQPDDNGNSPMMWMTAADNPDTKDAADDTKKLSAASHAKMMKNVAGLETHVKEIKSELSRQRANALQGYQVYGGNEPPEHKDEDEPSEDEDEATRLAKMREALYDLTTRLQFQNADKGI